MSDQPWISVEDRWPQHLSDVLVAYKCGNYVRLGVGEFDGTTVNDEGMTIPYFKGLPRRCRRDRAPAVAALPLRHRNRDALLHAHAAHVHRRGA